MEHVKKFMTSLKVIAVVAHGRAKDGLQVADIPALVGDFAQPAVWSQVQEGFKDLNALKQEVANASVGDWFGVLAHAVGEIQDAVKSLDAPAAAPVAEVAAQ